MADELMIVDGRTIELFNPRHDKAGRFARKVGGSISTARKKTGDTLSGRNRVIGEVLAPSITPVRKGKPTKTQKFGHGLHYGLMGAVLGSAVGFISGAAAGVVAEESFGVSNDDALMVALAGQAIGAGVGGGIGVKKGIERAKRRAKSARFSDIDIPSIKKLSDAFALFLSKKDAEIFVTEKSINPSFAKMGFKSEGKYLYADRQHIEKLSRAISELGSESKMDSLLISEGRTIELYNPRHDKLGRFAVSVGAGAVGGAAEAIAKRKTSLGVSSAIVAGGLARGEVRYGPKAKARIDKTAKRAASRVPDGYKNPDADVRMHKSVTRHILAGKGIPLIGASLGFVWGAGNKTANISGVATRWASKDAKTKKEKQRKVIAEAVIAHELIHTRKRGRKKRTQTPVEEGLTELLVESKTGYPSSQSYRHYSDSMAAIALKLNNGDRKKAIEWVDKAHYNMASFDDISSQFKRQGVNISARDLNAYSSGGMFVDSTKSFDYIGSQNGVSQTLTGSMVKYGSRGYSTFDASSYASVAVESLGWVTFLQGALPVAVAAGKGAARGARDFDDTMNIRNFPIPHIVQYLPYDELVRVKEKAMQLAKEDGLDPEEVEIQFAYGSDFVSMLPQSEIKKMVNMDEADIVRSRGEVQLFNPFHDKLGRFGRKKGGGGAAAFVRKNKGKIAVAGATTAALVAAGVVMYSQKGKSGNVISGETITPDINKANVPDATVKSAIGNVTKVTGDWESLGYRMRENWQVAMHSASETFKNTTGKNPSGIKLHDDNGLIHFSPGAVKNMAADTAGVAADTFKGMVTRGFV